MQANHPNLRSLLNSPYPENQQKQRVARSLRNYCAREEEFSESLDRLVYSTQVRGKRPRRFRRFHTMSALKGTALITGASTGIGAVSTDRLASRRYALLPAARSEEKLSEVAARLKSTGRRIETISADLTKDEGVRLVAERLSADSTITAL